MSILRHVLDTARRVPEAAALVGADGATTSYRDLHNAVHRLAGSLRRHLEPGDRVAVLSTKDPRTVIAMLAVLRAGCCYVPVDSAAPAKRQRFVVADAGCRAVLGAGTVDLGVPVLDEEPPVALPDAEPEPDAEAYVLYTSGSTGTPKGVVITHRNAAAFVDWAAGAFPLHEGDQVAVHAPLHFDLPVYDVYVGLGAGATLHLVSARTALFPQALQRFLAERAVSHLYAVPSALVALLNRSTLRADGLPALRRLLYAGEEFRAQALAELMRAMPHTAVANLYGPIETNVVTSHEVTAPPAPDERVPIGRPVAGTLIGLVDAAGTVSFDGVAEGELVVAGDCVTPGYLGRPELTAKASTQLSTSDGSRRFHRTGDIARRDADGLLHLLGRRDGLVKTRGYRVELGEVETAIGTHAAVAEVVVVALPDPELTHRLHALVVPVPGAEPTVAELTAHCRERLPHYMLPGELRVVADLPRTSTGKVARAELPQLVVRGQEA